MADIESRFWETKANTEKEVDNFKRFADMMKDELLRYVDRIRFSAESEQDLAERAGIPAEKMSYIAREMQDNPDFDLGSYLLAQKIDIAVRQIDTGEVVDVVQTQQVPESQEQGVEIVDTVKDKQKKKSTTKVFTIVDGDIDDRDGQKIKLRTFVYATDNGTVSIGEPPIGENTFSPK